MTPETKEMVMKMVSMNLDAVNHYDPEYRVTVEDFGYHFEEAVKALIKENIRGQVHDAEKGD